MLSAFGLVFEMKAEGTEEGVVPRGGPPEVVPQEWFPGVVSQEWSPRGGLPRAVLPGVVLQECVVP